MPTFPSATTNLRGELGSLLRRVSFAVPADIAPANILNGHILHIEPDIVTRQGLAKCLMVHFHRLHLCGDVDWRKGHHHTRPEDTGLHSAHRHGPNAWAKRGYCEMAGQRSGAGQNIQAGSLKVYGAQDLFLPEGVKGDNLTEGIRRQGVPRQAEGETEGESLPADSRIRGRAEKGGTSQAPPPSLRTPPCGVWPNLLLALGLLLPSRDSLSPAVALWSCH